MTGSMRGCALAAALLASQSSMAASVPAYTKDSTVKGTPADDTYEMRGAERVAIVEQPGGGTDTVDTWKDYVLPAQVENLREAGKDTLAVGNDLPNRLSGAGGSQAFVPGKGDDTITTGAGADVIVRGPDEGRDLVTDFSPAEDKILLPGFPIHDFEALRSRLSQDGADTLITFAPGDSIRLAGVRVSDLKAGNFGLPLDLARFQLDPEWSDEFNGTAVDEKRWDYAYPYSGEDRIWDRWLNAEHQVFWSPHYLGFDFPTHEVAGGLLTLRLLAMPDAAWTAVQKRLAADEPANPAQIGKMRDSLAKAPIRAVGGLLFAKRQAPTLGYHEIRAKFPGGAGTFGAIWLFAKPGAVPEIDIMEYVPQPARYRANTSWHSATPNGHSTIGQRMVDPEGGFHDYGVLVDGKTISYLIDRIVVASRPLPSDFLDDKGPRPFWQALDLAGGSWGGPIAPSALPAEMQVDYWRFYRPRGPAS